MTSSGGDIYTIDAGGPGLRPLSLFSFQPQLNEPFRDVGQLNDFSQVSTRGDGIGIKIPDVAVVLEIFQFILYFTTVYGCPVSWAFRMFFR